VSILIIQGQWSEVSITKVFTRVFGYLIVQELEVKNQSTLSSKGGDCLLVKVKCLPCRGNSMIPRALIASLNKYISLMSTPPYLCPLAF
jgi:hypothetical protein